MSDLVLQLLPFLFVSGILGWHAGGNFARKEWVEMTFTIVAVVLVFLAQGE